MAFGDFMGFGRSGALVFVVSAALAFACSGKSTGGDDDGDTGGSSNGGTAGSGGTSGASSGGTGSSSTTCVSVCERVAACPGADILDCAAECRDAADEAAGLGCSPEFQSYVACLATLSDVCTVDPETMCPGPISAYLACLSGDAPARCTESGAPEGATCVSLCERSAPCAGEATDCAASCADAAADIAASGCGPEYQRYMNCAATCENICSLSETDCPTTYAAFVDCYLGGGL